MRSYKNTWRVRNASKIDFKRRRLERPPVQCEAEKRFNPITGALEKQAGKQTTELAKVTRAIEHLPAAIAAETYFNPISALFCEDVPSIEAAPDSTLFAYPDKGINVALLRQRNLKLPSEHEDEEINGAVDAVNAQIHTLGQENARTDGPQKQMNHAQS